MLLLPEEKLSLDMSSSTSDRVLFGTYHHWEAGLLRPVIPTEVHWGRPMRGTYCPKHAAIHMQMEMLEQQILANEHGLEFKGLA